MGTLRVKNISSEKVENFAAGKLFIFKPGQCFSMPERYALKLTRNNPKQLALVEEPAEPSPAVAADITEVEEVVQNPPAAAEEDPAADPAPAGRPGARGRGRNR